MSAYLATEGRVLTAFAVDDEGSGGDEPYPVSLLSKAVAAQPESASLSTVTKASRKSGSVPKQQKGVDKSRLRCDVADIDASNLGKGHRRSNAASNRLLEKSEQQPLSADGETPTDGGGNGRLQKSAEKPTRSNHRHRGSTATSTKRQQSTTEDNRSSPLPAKDPFNANDNFSNGPVGDADEHHGQKQIVDVQRGHRTQSLTKKSMSHATAVPSEMPPTFNFTDYEQFPLFATTALGQTIKKVIEIVAPLVQDATLRFSKDGLSISGVEGVRMAVLSATFEPDIFYPWKCDKEFELGIDTPSLSRILQHVTKYDALTFLIPDKNQPQTLGILMVKWSDNTFNYMPLVGNEIYKNKGFKMPPIQFPGFMEMPAPAFQQYIHELLITATIVTFATDYKSFHMLSNGQNGGQFAPRHITIYPGSGVKFFDTQNSPSGNAKVAWSHNKLGLEHPQITNAFADDEEECISQSAVSLDGSLRGCSAFVEDDDGEDQGVEKLGCETSTTVNCDGGEQESTLKQDEEEDDGNVATGRKRKRGPGDAKTPAAAVQTSNKKFPKMADILQTMEKPLPEHFVRGTYMLKYVYVITKATQLARKVILLFQKDGPLILQYPIDHGKITYCLAVINADHVR